MNGTAATKTDMETAKKLRVSNKIKSDKQWRWLEEFPALAKRDKRLLADYGFNLIFVKVKPYF